MAVIMLDPAIGTLLASCYALLFASAAVHKFRDLAQFAETLEEYALLPGATVRVGARALPVLEAAVATGLLLPASRTLAAAAGIVLLVVYALAIGINLHRGRRDLACGCGAPTEQRAISPWLVWRNAGLAAALAAEFLPVAERTLVVTDAITIAGGAATAVFLYLGLDRLLGEVAPRADALKAPR